MGYDLNKFVDIQEISTQLRCQICSLVLQDPLQSPCEHNFCNQCITIYLQSSNHCPHYDEDSVSVKSEKKKSPLKKISSFRKIIGKSPKDKFPILKLSDLKQLSSTTLNELQSLKVYCDYHLNGCNQKLTLSNLIEHVKQCEYIEQQQQKQQTTTPTTTTEQSIKSDDQQINDQNLNQQQQSSEEEMKTKANKKTATTTTTSTAESKQQQEKDTVERKDSVESKSINGEQVKSTMASEEEVGSDDFVMLPKNVQAGSSSLTKSTESVQSSSGHEPVSGESKENINNQTESSNVEKKKKKKKKKKTATSKATDDDAVSLDATSLKGVESSSGSVDGGSKTQSKESLAEHEELKRTLKDLENKNENLRLINTQLLGQIKQLKDEKDEFNKKLQAQLNTSGEVSELKNKLQQLEKENKSQTLRIIQLLDSNENMNKFIVTLREEQAQLKEKYNETLNNVQQISKLVKSCKQEVILN